MTPLAVPLAVFGLIVAVNALALILMLRTVTRGLQTISVQQRDVQAALADIAAAIRARGPDLHLRLRDVPPGPGPGARTP